MPVSLYIIDTFQTSWYDFECDSANNPWDSTWLPFNSIHELDLNVIKIYPNPTNEFLQIDFQHLTGLKQIEIFDLQGKLIKQFETYENNYYLNTEILNRGAYVFRCKSNLRIFYNKIIKE
jgi:hypothetical protein